MPYYELSSMLRYKWDESNFNMLKELLKQVIEILIFTNKQVGFLHNDIHLDNVMLKKSKNGEIKVEIIDFDKSTINKDDKLNYKKMGENFRILFDSVSRLECISQMSTINLIIYTAKMRDPFENKELNIDDIYKYVNELSKNENEI